MYIYIYIYMYMYMYMVCILELLCSNGADVNLPTSDNTPPLFIAGSIDIYISG